MNPTFDNLVMKNQNIDELERRPPASSSRIKDQIKYLLLGIHIQCASQFRESGGIVKFLKNGSTN